MFSLNSKINVATFTRLLDKLGALLLKHNLVIDSRKIMIGDIFAAYPGTAMDGRKFIQTAIDKGAKFILWEETKDHPQCGNVDNLSAIDLAQYIGLLASYKYNYPTKYYNTIGVTGTNGKTSITHWLNQAYSNLNKKTAIIGTTGAGIYPNTNDFKMTTPDPITLQEMLANFMNEKIDLLAMEVSSHALIQGRVNGVKYDVAIWTNLTQDHLDYHGTMENYYQAKRNLFYWESLKQAIVNTDDKYGKRLYDEIKQSRLDLRCLSYGINSGDLYASNIKVTLNGTSFQLNYGLENIHVNVKLVGNFNVYNLLAVAGTLLLDGYSLAQIVPILEVLNPVPGRMETLILPNKPLVVVDYAHTPDALENVLNTLSQIEHIGKIYCVFGCGGDRDAKKRPIMGKIASEIADVVIVTSDNPRTENPEMIVQEVIGGIEKINYIAITDRKSAIDYALKEANASDIVLIAGKGHETYQEVCGKREHFSDVEVALNYLKDAR